jgi:hypothetical protein
MYGPIPQEIRVWIVDGSPIAWSFHYLGLLPNPRGFPPKASDLEALYAWAQKIGRAFQSRCVVADFAREINGDWLFIEAGPGSCAGTAHEHVFKAVACQLRGDSWRITSDSVGGDFGAIGG